MLNVLMQSIAAGLFALCAAVGFLFYLARGQTWGAVLWLLGFMALYYVLAPDKEQVKQLREFREQLKHGES